MNDFSLSWHKVVNEDNKSELEQLFHQTYTGFEHFSDILKQTRQLYGNKYTKENNRLSEERDELVKELQPEFDRLRKEALKEGMDEQTADSYASNYSEIGHIHYYHDEQVNELERNFKGMMHTYNKSLLISICSHLEVCTKKILDYWLSSNDQPVTGPRQSFYHSKESLKHGLLNNHDQNNILDYCYLLYKIRNGIVHNNACFDASDRTYADCIGLLNLKCELQQISGTYLYELMHLKADFIYYTIDTFTKLITKLFWVIEESNGYKTILSNLKYMIRAKDNNAKIDTLTVTRRHQNSFLFNFRFTLDSLPEQNFKCSIVTNRSHSDIVQIVDQTTDGTFADFKKVIASNASFITDDVFSLIPVSNPAQYYISFINN